MNATLLESSPPEYNQTAYLKLSDEYRLPNNSQRQPIPNWVPDVAVGECMICKTPFTLTFRRHHCRRCGICVCNQCAPKDNSRPIPEWGITTPVRHCKKCYV